MLRWTGANSGVTWIPAEAPGNWVQKPGDWGTCWSNEVDVGAYGGHEPWEATPT